MAELITLERFRAAARAGRPPPAGTLFRFSVEPAMAVDTASRRVRFCFSDGSTDRMGDTIAADGWELADFLKNPVALWAHNSFEPPIGRAANLAVEGERLMGDIEFAAAETYPFADTVYRLVQAKFVNAVSVGFVPIEWKFVDSKDRPFGIDFLKQELVEISVVPVPANANALAEARAAGIDTRPVVEWAERVLDGAGHAAIPKSELERLRKAAKEPPMARRRPAALREPENRDAGDGNDTGGMGETDPAAGGNLVANCGRKAEDECGMVDPQECSIHRTEEGPMDGKSVAAIVRREVKASLEGLLPGLIKAVRKADGEPDGDEMPDGDAVEEAIGKHLVHVKTAHFHAKECARCLRKALDAIDGVDPGNVIDPAEPNPEGEEKGARLALAAALRQI